MRYASYWTTDAIDISNYEDVNFSLDVGEYGSIDSDHYIETEYSTNNGSSLEYSNMLMDI